MRFTGSSFPLQADTKLAGDDDYTYYGDGNDIAIGHTTGISADTATADANIVGSPDVRTIPVDSLVISNKTNNSDIVFIAATGGNSSEIFRVDGSSDLIDLNTDIKIGFESSAYIYRSNPDIIIEPGAQSGNNAHLQIDNHGSAAAADVLVLGGNRGTVSTPANNDSGRLFFRLHDSGSSPDDVARIDWIATNVTSGASFEGDLVFYASKAGTLTELLRLDGSANSVVISSGSAGAIILGRAASNDETVLSWSSADLILGGDASVTGIGLAIDGSTQFFAKDISSAPFFYASATDGPALADRASTNTVPTLIPCRADTNTGLGATGGNSDVMSLIAGGGESARIDADSTAGNTRFLVYDVDNATLERVSVGAADSGGSGFKVLRIPN